MKLPKLVMTDIDGVWTDGGMYYDQLGNEWKKFNTSDSAGVLFLRELNIPLAIISGEDTEIVRRRAQKLNIDELHLGINDKVSLAAELLEKYECNWEQCAYIGDDLNDLALLKKVGFAACPKNAAHYIQQHVQWKAPISGGEGAFRAFVEEILFRHNLLYDVIDRIATPAKQ